MTGKVDLFDTTYGHFESDVLARVRRKTFGDDFGQNSWTTADEYRRWAARLGLDGTSNVLEVASGSGGPALFLAQLTGAAVTGVDINALAVATAGERSAAAGSAATVSFRQCDANQPLPFADDAFDALVCIDSANHFPDRLVTLREWRRVLRPGGRLLFTDPVVVTGLVTSEELAERSSIGLFVFSPRGLNEELLEAAGFSLIYSEDVTANAALTAGRWHAARADDREALERIEGRERFAGLQRFFATVRDLSTQGRLSRIAYFAAKE